MVMTLDTSATEFEPSSGLRIEATKVTPRIEYWAETATMMITGVSMPEDAVVFYEPIMNWLRAKPFIKGRSVDVHFRLDYFNTSSAKVLLEMFLQLDELYRKGYQLNLIWEFEAGDEQLREVGEEFGLLVSCPIRLTEY